MWFPSDLTSSSRQLLRQFTFQGQFSLVVPRLDKLVADKEAALGLEGPAGATTPLLNKQQRPLQESTRLLGPARHSALAEGAQGMRISRAGVISSLSCMQTFLGDQLILMSS